MHYNPQNGSCPLPTSATPRGLSLFRVFQVIAPLLFLTSFNKNSYAVLVLWRLHFWWFHISGFDEFFLLLVWFLSLCVARWEPEGTGGVEERQRWIFYTPQSAHTRTDTQPGHAIPPYSSTTPKISQFSDFPQLVN